MLLNEIEELNVQRNDLEDDDKYWELFISVQIACILHAIILTSVQGW